MKVYLASVALSLTQKVNGKYKVVKIEKECIINEKDLDHLSDFTFRDIVKHHKIKDHELWKEAQPEIKIIRKIGTP